MASTDTLTGATPGATGEKPSPRPGAGTPPLALQVGILGLLGGSAANHHRHRRRERGCADRVTKTHDVLPVVPGQ